MLKPAARSHKKKLAATTTLPQHQQEPDDEEFDGIESAPRIDYEDADACDPYAWIKTAEKKCNAKHKRWDMKFTLHQCASKRDSSYNPDTDEVLVVCFPRSSLKHGARAFSDFEHATYANLWTIIWGAIACVNGSPGESMQVVLECANSHEQFSRPRSTIDEHTPPPGPHAPRHAPFSTAPTDPGEPANFYPSLETIMSCVPGYDRYDTLFGCINLSDAAGGGPQTAAVDEYRLWIVSKKDALAQGVHSYIRGLFSLPTATTNHRLQKAQATANPTSTTAAEEAASLEIRLRQWIEIVKLCSGPGQKLRVVQDELREIIARDSRFNPSTMFAVRSIGPGSTLKRNMREFYCPEIGERAGEIVFPHPWKVLMINGVDRRPQVMCRRFLPEVQKRWCDPIWYASKAYYHWKYTRAELQQRNEALLAETSEFHAPKPVPTVRTVLSKDTGAVASVTDKLFSEQRLAKALSNLTRHFAEIRDKRYTTFARAMCYRFMTTQFTRDSKRASAPLLAAAAAYHDRLLDATRIKIHVACQITDDTRYSVFASHVADTSYGIRRFMDVPRACICNIMLLLGFRGRAYSTRPELGANIMVIGTSGIGKSCAFKAFKALCLPETVQDLTRTTEHADTGNTNDIDFIRVEHEKDLNFAGSAAAAGSSKQKHAVQSREAGEKVTMDTTKSAVRRLVGGQSVLYGSRCIGMRIYSSNHPYANEAYKNRFCWMYGEMQLDPSYVSAGEMNIIRRVANAADFVDRIHLAHMMEMIIAKFIDSSILPQVCLSATKEMIRLVNAVLKEYASERYPGRRIATLNTYHIHRVKMLAEQYTIKQAIAMLYGVDASSDSDCDERYDGGNPRPHCMYGKVFRAEDLVPHLAPWLKDSEEIAAFSMGMLRDEAHSTLETRVFHVIKEMVTSGNIHARIYKKKEFTVPATPLSAVKIEDEDAIMDDEADDDISIISASDYYQQQHQQHDSASQDDDRSQCSISSSTVPSPFSDCSNSTTTSISSTGSYKRKLQYIVDDVATPEHFPAVRIKRVGRPRKQRDGEHPAFAPPSRTAPTPPKKKRIVATSYKNVTDTNYIALEISKKKLIASIHAILKTKPSQPMESCVDQLVCGMMSDTVFDYPRCERSTGTAATLFYPRDKTKPKRNFALMMDHAHETKSKRSQLYVHASVFDDRAEDDDILRDAIEQVLCHQHAVPRGVLYGQPVDVENTHIYQMIQVRPDPTRQSLIATPDYVRYQYERARREDAPEFWAADCSLDDVSTKEILHSLGMDHRNANLVREYSPTKFGCVSSTSFHHPMKPGVAIDSPT